MTFTIELSIKMVVISIFKNIQEYKNSTNLEDSRRYSTMYVRMGAPPSEAGGIHLRATELSSSPQTFGVSGLPGLLHGSLAVICTEGGLGSLLPALLMAVTLKTYLTSSMSSRTRFSSSLIGCLVTSI